jgi:hypothetical protein
MPCTISISETLYYSFRSLRFPFLNVTYYHVACLGPMNTPM